MTCLAVLATGALLGVLSVREDTPTARTWRVLWADLHAAGWRRVAWRALAVTAGTAWLAVTAAARTGLYGSLLAAAALACLVASAVSLDGRRVRLAVGA